MNLTGGATVRSRNRINVQETMYQDDGWIVLGGSMQVSPGPPWTPGQSVDVSFTMENFTGENFCTTRAITAEGLERTSFEVCASTGGTVDVSETITIPDFPEQQLTEVTISVTGSGESVTGSIETGDGTNGTNGGGVGAIVSIRDLVVSPPPPWNVGEQLEVSVVFENTGDATGSSSADVFFNGSRVGTASATVSPGSVTAGTITASVPDTSFLEITAEGFSQSITGEVSPTDGDGINGGNGTNGDGGNGVTPPAGGDIIDRIAAQLGVSRQEAILFIVVLLVLVGLTVAGG